MHTRKISKQVRQHEQLILALLRSPVWKRQQHPSASYRDGLAYLEDGRVQGGLSKSARGGILPNRGPASSGAAVSTRLKVRVGKTTPPASRRRAVDCVQDRAAKSMALEDIEARLAELERAADRSQSENWV